jgi:hypothetical protein
MNTALLVLRLVIGVLFIGHGLQKLVPPKYSPPLLRAFGLQAAADGFDGLGVRPALPAALLARTAELVGGFSIAAGLLTPVGTLLITAVMNDGDRHRAFPQRDLERRRRLRVQPHARRVRLRGQRAAPRAERASPSPSVPWAGCCRWSERR